MSVLDPDIEQAVAEAIKLRGVSVDDDDVSFDARDVELSDPDPRTQNGAQVRRARQADSLDAITSNPADDQATRLRALIHGGMSLALGGAGVLPALGTSKDDRWAGETPAPPKTKTNTQLPTMIAVASGKGGVGKTNIAVNLAVVLAQRGSRVTLLDADLGTANADLLCGLTPAARLEHVISSLPVHDGARRSIRDIAVDLPGCEGKGRLIAGSSGVGRLADLSLAQQRQLLASLAELDDDTDVLIVDTSAGVGRTVTSFVGAADMTIVVTTPEPTAITDAYALIKCASADENYFSGGAGGSPVPLGSGGDARARGLYNDAPSFGLVINQASGEDEARRVHARLAAVCDRFLGVSLPMLGWVAHDLRLPEAVRARQPLVVRTPRAPAARHIQTIGATLAQQIGLSPNDSAAVARKLAGVGGIAGALARVLRFSAR